LFCKLPAAAALGLTETRLQDLASENDVDGLVSLLTSLSPEYVASLSDHTYTAVRVSFWWEREG
jgi:hypothetical protein